MWFWLQLLYNELTRVGDGYFIDFIRVKPYFLFTTSHYRGCKPLLQFEGTETEKYKIKMIFNIVTFIKYMLT